MTQIYSTPGSNKRIGAVTRMGSPSKIMVANKLAPLERDHKRRKDRASQNAYRRACGLPEVTP